MRHIKKKIVSFPFCLSIEFSLLLVQSLPVQFFWLMKLGASKETEWAYASGLWPWALSDDYSIGLVVGKLWKTGTTGKRQQLRLEGCSPLGPGVHHHGDIIKIISLNTRPAWLSSGCCGQNFEDVNSRVHLFSLLHQPSITALKFCSSQYRAFLSSRQLWPVSPLILKIPRQALGFSTPFCQSLASSCPLNLDSALWDRQKDWGGV